MYSKEKPLYRKVISSASQMDPDSSVQVHVKAKNTGKRTSDEEEMYVQHMGSAVTRSQLELKGFKRVRIEAGAEKDVTLESKARDLAFWDTPDHVWRVEGEKVQAVRVASLPVQTVVEVTGTKDYKP